MLYFPGAGTLGCVVCLAPQLFLVYQQANVGLPHLPAAASTCTVCCLAIGPLALAAHLHPSYQSG